MKKYLVKTLMIKCTACINGRHYPDTGGFNCNCDLSEPCSFCKGTRIIEITSKHPLFKEEYKKYVEFKIDELTTKYRKAKKTTGDLGDELGKYCKEFNKILIKEGDK